MTTKELPKEYEHKCNRCGETIITHSKGSPRSYKNNWITARLEGGVEGPRFLSDSYDFCHKCAISFEEWLGEIKKFLEEEKD